MNFLDIITYVLIGIAIIIFLIILKLNAKLND